MAIPKYQNILKLHLKGVSNLRIAKICNCSRTTVVGAVNECNKLELTLSQVEKMSDAQLKQTLYPHQEREQKNKPDVEAIADELTSNKDVTLKLLWKEYVEDCREKKAAPLMYSRFCYYYQQHAAKKHVSGHIERESGFSAEVDWGGTIMHWQDVYTGELLDAYLFVACLSYSRYTYCEAFANQIMDSWIIAHNHMFRFFQGVPKILICDNLKTGVVKHIKGETKINQTYLELAKHYGTVISPARVRHPKGKPNVEDSVGIIANNVIAALRHQIFNSLGELNKAIYEKIEEINACPFQKREGSRKLLFKQVECNDLQPLPATPYELAEWHTSLKVQYNYHVKVDKWFYYSVPSQYIGKQVSLRMTTTVVEIFFSSERIATHTKNYDKRHPYRTEILHMPTAQQEAQQRWNERRFLSWANSIGPHTGKVVSGVLSSRQVIQQAYPGCMALLNLAQTYGNEHLEQVCTEIIDSGLSPSFTNVKNLLAAMAQESTAGTSAKPVPKGLLRDPSYYREMIAQGDTHDQR